MYTFIVNPHARSGMGQKVWSSISSHLKELTIDYQVLFTQYQRHATTITQKLTSGGKHCTIIILGGDGTVNEVLNGIADLDLVTLGYIPIGSSNDFARGYGLSTEPAAALRNVTAPSKYYYMNVGILSYQSKIQHKTRRFAVSSGIGFDAEVCHQVVISKMKVLLNKLKLGKLAYVGVALQRMLALRPGRMTLLLDDNIPIAFSKCFFIAAMNHKYEGGGFQFCPKADPKDDMLDIIVIADISKLKALALLPTAFAGKHVHFKGVSVYRCRKAQITSEYPMPVHTDGEPIFLQRDVLFSLEKKKVRVIAS